VVDLQRVNRQHLQLRERRVARAEVVDADAHAEPREREQHFERTFTILHHCRFGDLEHEQRRIESRRHQHAFDERHDVGVEQLPRRKVHGNSESVVAVRLDSPARGLGACFAEHPRPDRNDESRLLGDVEELVGLHHAALAVLPAHERLEAHDFGGLEVHERLVVHAELAPHERAAQRPFDFEPAHSALTHCVVEHFHATAAEFFGGEHRNVRVAQQARRRVVASA
jgi:hypothetical protein